MSLSLPEPGPTLTDPADLLLQYLGFYRSEVLRKIAGLGEDDLRASRLPSGWSPLELLSHLVHMERRWLVWGFAGERLDRPWGDQDEDGRWHVPPEVTVQELGSALVAGAQRTHAIVAAARLTDHALVGGRFASEPTPTLSWILFHVLQEYARHAGHLDVARELVDGFVGEDPEAPSSPADEQVWPEGSR
jgi:uncharacterized damage-inducible protein DinB